MKKFRHVHRLLCLIALAACSWPLSAQLPQTVSFTVSTNPAGAQFSVDGQVYTSIAQFEWPAGSKHIVSFLQSQLPQNAVVVQPPSSTHPFPPEQLSVDGTTMYIFAGWLDSTGLLAPVLAPTQVVTADPTIHWLTATVAVSYRVLLNFFFNAQNASPVCPTVGDSSVTRAGVVYINGGCFWSDALLYFPAGTALALNAIPFPGFVFLGWSGLGPSKAYLQSYVLNGAITLEPNFGPGKRVRVETKPLGLNALVDRTQAVTMSVDPTGTDCPEGQHLPLPVPSFAAPLCFGDFDFAPASNHLIGAITPQTDMHGKLWVFNSWSSALGQSGLTENAIYVTDEQTSTSDKVTVSFDPGAQVSFVTSPSGLPLTIDGRSNWPGYNFVWAQGSTHQVAAAAQVADSTGRQYTFGGWSNGAGASQTVAVDQTGVNSGIRLIASYSKLSRTVVQTSPPGQPLQIDGSACAAPCNVDRSPGATIHLKAPTAVIAGPGVRLDFASWSDGGTADHVATIAGDYQTLTASYSTSYQLTTGSNPANGADLVMSPASPDTYYPANTPVSITASPHSGFQFRRWGGDLSGTYPSGTISMTGGPHSALALLDRVPFIAPAGVVNGAGTTPDVVVGAGSIAMILGESLAPDTVVGPANPLKQTLDNVTVTVGEQLLPIFSVTPQQVTVLLPSSLAEGEHTLQVHSQGQPDVTANFTVARDAPGVFTNPADGKAYILALHANGKLVTAANPAQQNEQITFYGTGFGPYSKAVVDGFFPPSPAPAVSDPVDVKVGGLNLQPDWVGAAAGYTGLVAVKLTISDAIPAAAEVSLQVQINGRLSNRVVLPLK